jgi:hypothetical protein
MIGQKNLFFFVCVRPDGMLYQGHGFEQGGESMKKTALFLCIAVLALGLAACKGAGGKYSDVVKVMDKYVASMEKFAGALEGAKSADDVATALDSLTTVTKTLAPEMKAFETKYPEFKNQENPPAELKPIMDKVMAASTKMMGAMSKVMQYAQDPKVQEAQKKYQEAMALTK